MATDSYLPVFYADIPPFRALGGADAEYFSPDAETVTLANSLAGQFQGLAAVRFATRL